MGLESTWQKQSSSATDYTHPDRNPQCGDGDLNAPHMCGDCTSYLLASQQKGSEHRLEELSRYGMPNCYQLRKNQE
jgi:hypothetical protein